MGSGDERAALANRRAATLAQRVKAITALPPDQEAPARIVDAASHPLAAQVLAGPTGEQRVGSEYAAHDRGGRDAEDHELDRDVRGRIEELREEGDMEHDGLGVQHADQKARSGTGERVAALRIRQARQARARRASRIRIQPNHVM